MESLTFYLLLLTAIIAGWLLGRLASSKSTLAKTSSADLFQDYFVGLNYLLNDEPDEAIDTFIKALELNDYGLKVHRLCVCGLKVLVHSKIIFPVSPFDGSR